MIPFPTIYFQVDNGSEMYHDVVGGHTITQIAHIIAQWLNVPPPHTHTHTIEDSFFTGGLTKFNTLSLTSMKTILTLWAYFRGQSLG